MAMNLRQIEVFRAVMITRSIQGASRLLNVSQPAVSRLLSHTESRIGFPLFDRIKGRLYATPEAKSLFKSIEAVYEGVQKVNQIAKDLSEHQHGILNVVSSPSVGQMLIPEAIAAFGKTHPDVKITFQYLQYDALLQKLLAGSADIGMTVLPVDHPNLEVIPVGNCELVCILPPGHPVAAKERVEADDFAGHSLITYDAASHFGMLVNSVLDRAGQRPQRVIEVGSPQNACALVQAGAGIALVDEFSVKSWPNASFQSRRVVNSPRLEANLIHQKFEPLSQLTRSFMDSVREQMAALQGRGDSLTSC
jgi:DNA-binding transcriptional LysR family regulator